MKPHNPTFTFLLPLLLALSLGCADKPTEPELTEEEIRQIIAEEIAKLDTEETHLSPQEIAEIALKSTVYLSVKTQDKSYYGSGFVVREGLIATCEHVLEGMVNGTAEPVFDETKYPITSVLAASEKHDLAIVGVQGFDAPALPLGDSDEVQIGEDIFVVGNPKKLKGIFSEGIISGIRAEGNELVRGKVFQMTAPISPGSSGGPVINRNGEIVGLAGGDKIGAQNLNFAIPVNHLKALLKTIR